MLVRYYIRERIRDKLRFVDVVLSTEVIKNQIGLIVEIDCEIGQFKKAIEIGAESFYTYFLESGNKGLLKVKIVDLVWYDIHTNNIGTMYAVMKALEKSLNLEVKGLELDKAAGNLTLPYI